MRRVRLIHQLFELLDDLRILLRDIRLLFSVDADVVKLCIAAEHWLADGLPLAGSYRLTRALFVKLPVQKIGCLLFAGPTAEGGVEAD